MSSLKLQAAILAVFALPYSAIADYGDPSIAEQIHLEAINRARANPSAEATLFGMSDVTEGTNGKLTNSPQAPLVFNAKLLQSSRGHSLDMATRGYFEHTSPEGTTPFTRMTGAGYNYSFAGENIALFGGLGSDAVANSLQLYKMLFVDDGVSGRGHRINLLSANFKEIGIGVVADSSNVFYVTQDLASNLDDSRAIVLGVVYDDKNKDGAYSAGEGLSGVTITLSTGEKTTTATAGGYGLPLNNGSYQLTFSHPTYGTVTKTLQLSSKNVKIDAKLSEFSNSSTINNNNSTTTPNTTTNTTTSTNTTTTNTSNIGSGSCNTNTCSYQLNLAQSGYYVAVVKLAANSQEGFWGLAVNTSSGVNVGGFTAGAVLKENGAAPGFVAFFLSQPVAVNVLVQEYTNKINQFTVSIDSVDSSGKRSTVYGPVKTKLGVSATTSVLQPGFYVAQAYSQTGDLRGRFGMALNGEGFVSGVNIGGWLDSTTGGTGEGFGAFYVASPQVVNFNMLFGTSYGTAGAGKLLLDVYYENASTKQRQLVWSSSQ